MLNVGIIGAGDFGIRHAQAIADLDDIRIVAASRTNQEKLAGFTAQFGGTGYTDYHDLLADPAVDAVMIATPHHLHTHAVQAAASARKAILLEKPMAREYSLADLLARPGVTYQALQGALDRPEAAQADWPCSEQAARQVEIQIKYQGYIDRQQDEIEKLKRQENTPLPVDFDYQQMQGLSNELKQKLEDARPENIGRAARIPGMTPAAISLLLIYLKKYQAIRQKVS